MFIKLIYWNDGIHKSIDISISQIHSLIPPRRFFFFFCGPSSLVSLHPPSDNVIKVNVDGSSIGR